MSTDMAGKHGGILWFIFGLRWPALCLYRVSDSLLSMVVHLCVIVMLYTLLGHHIEGSLLCSRLGAGTMYADLSMANVYVMLAGLIYYKGWYPIDP